MWEESPIGVWTLEILNDGRSVVELKDWRLVLWGTEFAPQPKDDSLSETPKNETLLDGNLNADGPTKTLPTNLVTKRTFKSNVVQILNENPS
jgi:hypothetical protein